MKSRKAELIARAVTSLNIIDACSCVRLLCTSGDGHFLQTCKECVEGIQNNSNNNNKEGNRVDSSKKISHSDKKSGKVAAVSARAEAAAAATTTRPGISPTKAARYVSLAPHQQRDI